MTTAPLAPSLTRRNALTAIRSIFAEAGLAEPDADARIMLEEAIGERRLALLVASDQLLGEAAAACLNGWVPRRLAREPIFRILGQREFWGLALRVTPDVLDPRPDTETVVSAALRAMASRRSDPLRVLDLGTGSGALLCALLSEWSAATGIGIDVSTAACAVAHSNLAACGLADRGRIVVGDWAERVEERFDCIVSNPPYVPTGTVARLDPEVRGYDPLLALDGGADGLAAYRSICGDLPRLLSRGGVALLEVGAGQAPAVTGLIVARGLHHGGTTRDLAGHERVVAATLRSAGS